MNPLVALLRAAAASIVLATVGSFVYQAARALWGLRRPAPLQPRTDLTFGIVIAAHNEANAMSGLFESLRQQRYPFSKMHVLFVADHCSDDTASQIEAAGFRVLQRNDGHPGKSGSLASGCSSLLASYGDTIDAFAIFDADNFIDPGFLAQAAAGLSSGHAVLQGRVTVQNWRDTVFSRLNYLNAVVENRLEELARSQAGLTCNLRGHGMVFRSDLSSIVFLPAQTLVEDQEALIRLVVHGHRAHWLEHAVVASVIPSSAAEAAAQRRRWAGGRSAMVGPAVRALWHRAVGSKDAVALNLLIDFILPSHAVQISLAFVSLALAVLCCGLSSWQTTVAASLLLAYFLYFIVGALLARLPLRVYLDVLVAPAYIAWRTWIYLTSRTGRSRWK